MGSLYRFICKDCGWVIDAPNNDTGRYCVRSGTIQLFHNKVTHEVDECVIAWERYLNCDDINDVEAKEAVEHYQKGDYDFLFGPIVAPDLIDDERMLRKTSVEPWNARTCRCPKCGGEMNLPDFPLHLMVD